jgi:redox-sensitive bicupin YhaK (pirin superfamily)
MDSVIETLVHARPRDLGGFTVGRALPSPQRRLVGPFVFFDHMGPVAFDPGHGIDVRPHPHIGLATVTYLLEGEIVHRDSLGFEQPIRPGDVNWMVAGRGIVHSERTSPERREHGQKLHGLQAWVALPDSTQECEPQFYHHPAASLPRIVRPGAELRLIAGHAYGERSPVAVASPTFYLQAQLAAAAELKLTDEHEERAVYIVSGRVRVGDDELEARSLAVLRPGAAVSVSAIEPSCVMLLGGAPVGERFVEWNFVSNSQERIARAKAAWRERRFPVVPGDSVEYIPLP